MGFLLAGLVLSAFGFTATPFLKTGAEVGVTLLLFTIGLKLKIKNLTKPEVWAGGILHIGLTVAVLGFAIFCLGFSGLRFFLEIDLSTALLLAFSLSFSSTVFAVKILDESGRMDSLNGRTAIGILIIQDIVAVIYLTVSTGKLPSVWALLVIALLPIARKLFQLMLSRVGHGELMVLLGLFVALIAGAHTFLGTCLLTGTFSLNKKKLLNYLVVTLLLTGAVIGGTRVYFSHFVKNIYTKDKALVEMNLLRNPVKAKIYKSLPPPLPPHDPGKPLIDEIHRRGFMRVGYLKNQLPYAFRNTKGELVGFDIEMAHELARTLDVTLEFVILKRDKTAVERLNAGYCDIIMSGIRITPKRAEKITFSEPYMDETMAFVVKDYRSDEFNSWKAIEKLDAPRIGIGGNIPYYISKLRKYLPEAEIVILNSPREFFKKKGKDLDALLFTAEAGSAWTLLYPDYTVVVPHPDIIAVPLAYALAYNNQKMADYMNSWIELKKKDKTIEKNYNYWILGQGATKKELKWSVIRNVLHWVD